MPLYEYECQSCGARFERVQSFSDVHAASCPNGHQNTRRLLSTPAIVFKGNGFYVTDSRSSSSSSSNNNKGD